jgi:transcriptional regulator with XRE-family HTH domain
MGERTQEARRTAGLGIAQAAQLVGISADLLSLYEAGSERIAPEHLVAIAAALGAPIASFFPSPDSIPQAFRDAADIKRAATERLEPSDGP